MQSPQAISKADLPTPWGPGRLRHTDETDGIRLGEAPTWRASGAADALFVGL